MAAHLAESYRKPVTAALVVQVLVLLWGSLMLDCGGTLRVAVFAAIPYWCGVLLVALRRPKQPTQVDLALIALGYPLLLALVPPLLLLFLPDFVVGCFQPW